MKVFYGWRLAGPVRGFQFMESAMLCRAFVGSFPLGASLIQAAMASLGCSSTRRK